MIKLLPILFLFILLGCQRGQSIPVEYPLQSARVSETGFGATRAEGAELDSLVELSCFGGFSPVRHLREARERFGDPSNVRITEDDRVYEYFFGSGGRVDVVEHLLAGECVEYYLLCHPVNLAYSDFFKPAILEAIEPYFGPSTSERTAVLYDPSGNIEMVVKLNGLRVEEVMW